MCVCLKPQRGASFEQLPRHLGKFLEVYQIQGFSLTGKAWEAEGGEDPPLFGVPSQEAINV